jgi:cold shock CspA family protein
MQISLQIVFEHVDHSDLIQSHVREAAGDKFDDLKVGQEVRFAEAVGDKEPQATSVRPIGKHHVD